jgi:hypothetical protein
VTTSEDTHDTKATTEPSKKCKRFFEKEGREYGANDDREGAKRCLETRLRWTRIADRAYGNAQQPELLQMRMLEILCQQRLRAKKSRKRIPAKLQISPRIITGLNVNLGQLRKGERTHWTCPTTIMAVKQMRVSSKSIPGLTLTDLRYATPSPAVWPACERRRPFFLKTKLEPIRRPLVTARIIPTI